MLRIRKEDEGKGRGEGIKERRMAIRRERLRKDRMEGETNSGEGVKAEGRQSKVNTERLF